MYSWCSRPFTTSLSGKCSCKSKFTMHRTVIDWFLCSLRLIMLVYELGDRFERFDGSFDCQKGDWMSILSFVATAGRNGPVAASADPSNTGLPPKSLQMDVRTAKWG
jgi:hypothetical protein